MLGHAGGDVVELLVLVVVYGEEVRHVVVDVGGAAVARLGALETLPPVEGLDRRGQLLQPVDLRLLEGGEQVAHAHPPRVFCEKK